MYDIGGPGLTVSDGQIIISVRGRSNIWACNQLAGSIMNQLLVGVATGDALHLVN